MNNIKSTALAVGLVCCATGALAQEINPSWYIQPGIQYVDPDRDFGTDERDYGAALRLGKPVSAMWDLQIGASHARSEQGPFNYRQTLVGADALLMLSRSTFRPFLLFGIGAQRDRLERPLGRVSGTSPYFTAGLGFQLGLTDQWSMQADLRSVRGRLRHKDDFGFDKPNNKYLTIGVNYAFSTPPAAPPPPAVIAQPAPAPEPVPAPPPPARFEKVTLTATELFEFDSARLGPVQSRLDEIAAALSADPSITDVDISGYADRLGSAKYNLKLSEQRANAVRDYLVAKGIDGARLKAYGKGEANPVVTCDNKNRAELIKCLEPNRRVEVEQITIERRVTP